MASLDRLQRHNEELQIINSIAAALNREVDLNNALQVTMAQVAEFLSLETGWVLLLHEDTGDSYLAAAQNMPPALADDPQRMIGTCYCLDTFREGDLEGAANVNVVRCSRLRWLMDGTEGLRYHASIPLYAHDQGQKLGVLNLASRDWRELSEDDLRLLHTIGDLLGIAIERARLYAASTEMGIVKERNRLAREIHDTLAQGLSAITLQLEAADAILDTQPDNERVHRQVMQALVLARLNLEEARRSVMDLRAAPLEGKTLIEALQSLADQCPAHVRFSVIGDLRPFPVRVETGLYRIAQETLGNVMEHAEATEVKMRLSIFPDRLELHVEDNGSGFEPERVGKNKFGLIGLNERAKLLGGSFYLESTRGVGTRVEVVIPLD